MSRKGIGSLIFFLQPLQPIWINTPARHLTKLSQCLVDQLTSSINYFATESLDKAGPHCARKRKQSLAGVDHHVGQLPNHQRTLDRFIPVPCQLHRLALIFEVQNLIALGQILLVESDRFDRFGPTRNFGLARPRLGSLYASERLFQRAAA